MVLSILRYVLVTAGENSCAVIPLKTAVSDHNITVVDELVADIDVIYHQAARAGVGKSTEQLWKEKAQNAQRAAGKERAKLSLATGRPRSPGDSEESEVPRAVRVAKVGRISRTMQTAEP